MNRLEGLRALLQQTEADKSIAYEYKIVLIQLLNTLIRSNELTRRYDEYFRKGYNLGYFLIQSQRMEQTLKGVIDSAEKLRAKVHNTTEKNIKTDIPLGALIKILEKYIKGDTIFLPLNNFNKYRRAVIHKIAEDFSKSLTDIEASIENDYPPDKINNLQNILFEVSRRINIKLVDLADDPIKANQATFKINQILLEGLGLSNLEFEIL